MSVLPNYEVYALRYAHMARRRADNFIGGDPHDADMPMDFYVWLLRRPGRTILVDTGFGARAAQQRHRRLKHCPIALLGALGVTDADIDDVILTHLHYDHAGNLEKLPHARLHIQDDEVDYATGRCMCFPALRHAYDVEDVVTLVRRVFDDRVVFHRGDAVLDEGVALIRIGGHTRGLQSVRVHTERGWIVLASDASHYYEGMQNGRLFPIVYSTAEMLAGYDTLRAHADSPDHIVPGHDPLVLRRYPSYRGHEDIVMLHRPPRSEP